jgi:hypothetical protein
VTGLAIPKRLKMNSSNRPLCARIGIMFNGRDRNDVAEYDVERGYIRLENGDYLHGDVVPYWRGARR